MAKTLNFNTVKQYTLPLIMRDAEQTHIDVTLPKEGLIEELQNALPELGPVLRAGDLDTIRETYNLAANLISCNLTGLVVTADDLRGKYKMDLGSLVLFIQTYMDFLSELNQAKN